MRLFITVNYSAGYVPFDQVGMSRDHMLEQASTTLRLTFPNQPHVVCIETGEQAHHTHFHIYLELDTQEEYTDAFRNALRRNLSKLFCGYIRISGKQVEDKIRNIAYILKDGYYKTYKIDWLTFLEAKKTSHPKTQKKTYQEAYKEWFDSINYDGTNVSEDEAVSRLLAIYIEFRLPINYDRMRGQVASAMARKNKEYFDIVKRRIKDGL